MTFAAPVKRIKTESDVAVFEKSAAYRKLQTYLRALCASVTGELGCISDAAPSGLDRLLDELTAGIQDYAPTETATRFGNPRYRDWHAFALRHVDATIRSHLPKLTEDVLCEIVPYLAGSFGHPERLDFGTGHELSFLPRSHPLPHHHLQARTGWLARRLGSRRPLRAALRDWRG